MTRHFRLLLAFLVLAVPGTLLAACGGIPGNAVATVDGDPIEKSSFDHWASIIAKSSGQTSGVPKPPQYAACVASLRKTAPKPAKGQPKVTDAQLKSQCKQQYESLRDSALQVLIPAAWLDREAEEMDIKVTDAEIKKGVDKFKQQPQFAEKGAYDKFLKTTGATEDDLALQARTELLTTKITEKITKGKTNVTDAEIKSYYDKNKAQFAKPEQRDLRVVLTKTKAKAEQAEKALDGGDSFASVAEKFSTDPASKKQGGKLTGVAKGQQEQALDKAVFAAEKGQLEGPVKTQFGYYVFEVSKITAASQQTLEQAKAAIKPLLVSQKREKAIQKFAKSFQEDWKEKTECRKGYVTQGCKGAPKPTPTPAAPQQVPQQAPQQTPPPE